MEPERDVSLSYANTAAAVELTAVTTTTTSAQAASVSLTTASQSALTTASPLDALCDAAASGSVPTGAVESKGAGSDSKDSTIGTERACAESSKHNSPDLTTPGSTLLESKSLTRGTLRGDRARTLAMVMRTATNGSVNRHLSFESSSLHREQVYKFSFGVIFAALTL